MTFNGTFNTYIYGKQSLTISKFPTVLIYCKLLKTGNDTVTGGEAPTVMEHIFALVFYP